MPYKLRTGSDCVQGFEPFLPKDDVIVPSKYISSSSSDVQYGDIVSLDDGHGKYA